MDLKSNSIIIKMDPKASLQLLFGICSKIQQELRDLKDLVESLAGLLRPKKLFLFLREYLV